MDRRDFLKSSGAAAVAVGTAAAPASDASAAPPAPALASGVREVRLAVHGGPGLPGQGAERLAHAIETALEGRWRIGLVEGGAGAELDFGSAHRHARLHPAFALFAGLPCGQGLDAGRLHTWLVAGGGGMLWEELGAGFGFRPLAVGHTGPSQGLWAAARLETPADFAGARLHVEGLAADSVAALGASPLQVAAAEVRSALSDGRLAGAEWLGALAEIAPDLQPPAQRLYAPGINRAGALLSLAVSRSLWEAMSTGERAVLEACAAREHQLSLADAHAHALIAAEAAAPAKWPVRLPFPAEVAARLERAAAEAVERAGDADAEARRILDSYRGFRRLSAGAFLA